MKLYKNILMRGKCHSSFIDRSWLCVLLLACLAAGCSTAAEPTASLSPLAAAQTPLPETPAQAPEKLPSETASVTPSKPSTLPASNTPSPSPSETPTPSGTPTPAPIIFAAIGDYGSGDQNEAAVAALVLSWQPEIILTLGDNNYPIGSPETIDANIGQFYHSYIYPYIGAYGEGGDTNRFFPVIGNHDILWEKARPYLDYFSLPGNERYYDFTWGPVHFFALDNESNEADGVGSGSIQAQWLQERLAASTSPWKVVTMHYPAFSSGYEGSTDWAQWPYAAWGADAVLAGHDHTYERLVVDGIPYIVNGLGGGAIYSFENIVPQSVMRYNTTYGALWGEASEHKLALRFISIEGEIVDIFEIEQ